MVNPPPAVGNLVEPLVLDVRPFPLAAPLLDLIGTTHLLYAGTENQPPEEGAVERIVASIIGPALR